MMMVTYKDVFFGYIKRKKKMKQQTTKRSHYFGWLGDIYNIAIIQNGATK